MVQKTCPALASMAIDSLIHEFPKASLRSLVQHASPCTHHLVDYTITGTEEKLIEHDLDLSKKPLLTS